MSTILGHSVPFWKMQGCGNDFVVIDNRGLGLPREAMPRWAEKACAKSFGVGADGIFFWREPDPASPAEQGCDIVWDFYNNDGSRAEMCGNASRCSGRLAHALGLVEAEHVLGTDAGPIRVRVLEDVGEVKVQLTEPKDEALDLSLDVEGAAMAVHFVDTGVPHAVVFAEDVAAVDVAALGRLLRFHPHFAPAGANVNFAQVLDENTVRVRTYERGVEAETYACGTGVSAVQLIAHRLGLTGPASSLTTTGGETLTVSVEHGGLFLQGGAECTFSGRLYLEPLSLSEGEDG